MNKEEIRNPIDQVNIIIGDYYPHVDIELAIEFAMNKVMEFISLGVCEPTFVYMDQFNIEHEMSPRQYWLLVYERLKEIKTQKK